MSAARPRSRLVKLIFFIASTIGRASKLLMSICSTSVPSSSALRVSLTGTVVIRSSPYPRDPGEGRGPGGVSTDSGLRRNDGEGLQRDDVRRDRAFLDEAA